jgi:pimeloyl-ACP methyl ester carboxylesterase
MLDLQALETRLHNDAVLNALPGLGSCSIRFTFGEDSFMLHTAPSVAVREVTGLEDSCDFSYSIPPEAWELARRNPPPAGYNTSQSIVAHLGDHVVGGNRTKWAQYAPVVERVLHNLREAPDAAPEPELPRESQTVGRYVMVDVDEVTYRIFYESAGEGVPLVCLHTAGSDSRQYRFILEDREITSSFRVLAFDLPWHGRSSPPSNWRSTRYELRTEWYAAVILAFCEALELDAPVLMGCSMGGTIGLYMSSVHGDAFRAVCALEGALDVPGRRVKWTRHSEVDRSLFLSTWVAGLMAPSSPVELRDQVLWEYAQGGPGIYNGDTYFLTTDTSLRTLKPATCPLYVFSGEYDHSATPEASRRAAEQLGGKFIFMEAKGHFPMCEDPVGFRPYLMPVLEEILANNR